MIWHLLAFGAGVTLILVGAMCLALKSASAQYQSALRYE